MREINECTAEVFRRSEKRIKERKRNRNRILTLCIPFCLIVTVCSVMILPAIFSSEKGINSIGGVDGVAAYVQVEVKSTGNTMQYDILTNDADEMAQIYYTIQSAFMAADKGETEAETHGMSDSSGKYYFWVDENTAKSGYKVIFTAENGEKTVFLITKDKLINESTKMKVKLTKAMYSEILTALGLTDTLEEEPR